MKHITIEKIDQETTYQKITRTHTFMVGDKEVRVYEHSYNDEMSGESDYDSEVDEQDEEALDEDERDAFQDEVGELLGAKVGKKVKVKISSIEDEE